MNTPQAGILLPLPALARYLSFSLEPAALPGECLHRLVELVPMASRRWSVLAARWSRRWRAEVPGLRSFPALAGPGLELPATPAAVWVWLRGDDRGEILHRSRRIAQLHDAGFSTRRLARCLPVRWRQRPVRLRGRHREPDRRHGGEDRDHVGDEQSGTWGFELRRRATLGARFCALRKPCPAARAGPQHRSPARRQPGNRRCAGIGTRQTHRAGELCTRRLSWCADRCHGPMAIAVGCCSRPSPPRSIPSRPSCAGCWALKTASSMRCSSSLAHSPARISGARQCAMGRLDLSALGL
jgi:hypothetical protein